MLKKENKVKKFLKKKMINIKEKINTGTVFINKCDYLDPSLLVSVSKRKTGIK